MCIDAENAINTGIDQCEKVGNSVLYLYGDDALLSVAGQQNNTVGDPVEYLHSDMEAVARLAATLDVWARQRNAAGPRSMAPLQRRFEIIARTTPGAPALRHGDRRLAYGELDVEADELALQLQRGGLRPGSFCLLRLAPSPARIRATLAILKAGGACLELDPALPPAGVATVVRLLQPALLFVPAGEGAVPERFGMGVVRAGDEAGCLPYGWPDEAPVTPATPAHAWAGLSGDGGVLVRVMTHLGLVASLASPRTSGPPAGAGHPTALWEPLSTGAMLTIPTRQ